MRNIDLTILPLRFVDLRQRSMYEGQFYDFKSTIRKVNEHYPSHQPKNSLNGNFFVNDVQIKCHIIQFFTEKTNKKEQKFYDEGIKIIPQDGKRWQNVIHENGA